jgi:hypothetical protein
LRTKIVLERILCKYVVFQKTLKFPEEKQRFGLPETSKKELRWFQDDLWTALGMLWVALGPLLAALGLL